MKRKAYETIQNEDKTVFKFTSTGGKGVIVKVVSFYSEGGNTWGLGFGDETTENEFDDRVISNNNDIFRVIQTVANTIHDFMEAHPGCNVLIEGVDVKRKALYNQVFKRKWEEIRTQFTVFGVSETNIESYDPKKTYGMFVVSKKMGYF